MSISLFGVCQLLRVFGQALPRDCGSFPDSFSLYVMIINHFSDGRFVFTMGEIALLFIAAIGDIH